MQIGDRVKILKGASDWMKIHNFWLASMPESIDDLYGTIASDQSTVSGDYAHYGIIFDNMKLYGEIGVNPKWIVNR